MMKTFIHLLIGFALLFPLTGSGQWSPKIKLSPGSIAASLNENMGPCLAVSGDTLHVVWSDHRSYGTAIYYSHSHDRGLNWSAPIALTDTTGNATFPAVAVSGGIVHLVWFNQPNSWYRRSVDGGVSWGSAVLLDNNTKFWPGISSSGSMVVVSLNKEVVTGNTEVFFRRSMNNGITWESEVQISNANGRSEDPAISARDSQIHLAWNDNRDGNMRTYYRRSLDYGLSWGPETSLINGGAMSYSTMVSLNGPYVDVPCGDTRTGNYDIWIKQSSDTGSTWTPEKQLTNDPALEAYPYLVRDSMRLHLVFIRWNTGAMYMNSIDGGSNWSSPVLLGKGGQPYIAFTGCVLHAIWPDSGSIWYSTNPTGNCDPTGIPGDRYPVSMQLNLKIRPNVIRRKATIEFNLAENCPVKLQIFDISGREKAVLLNEELQAGLNSVSFSADGLPPGIYICKLIAANNIRTEKLVIVK